MHGNGYLIFTGFKLALLLTLLNACGADNQVFTPLPLQSAPDLGETSDQPVTLKYRFEVNQRVRAKVDVAIISVTSFDDAQQADRADRIGEKKISADIEYNVGSVNSKNNAEVVFRITGIQFFSQAGESQQYFSSNLALLKDSNIKLTISEFGEIQNRDFSQLRLKAKQENLSHQYKQLQKIANWIINEVFTPLPNKAVKVGMIAEAGPARFNFSGLKKYKLKLMYRIKAVSKNRKLVLLEPIYDFDSVQNDSKVTIIKSGIKSWRLFDLENGRFARSSSDNQYELKVKLLDAVATIGLISQTAFRVVD